MSILCCSICNTRCSSVPFSLVSISMGLCACNSAGHLSNHADIAPNHAGATFAVSNSLVSVEQLIKQLGYKHSSHRNFCTKKAYYWNKFIIYYNIQKSEHQMNRPVCINLSGLDFTLLSLAAIIRADLLQCALSALH